ncbi:MAG: rRNA maturation RNase YbeY [Planctomycetota bacterium]
MPQPHPVEEISEEDPEPESNGPPVTSGLEVVFTLDTDDTSPPSDGWLVYQLAKACRLVGIEGGQLSVTLVDDPVMSRLHADHCDDPSTTDVLTFDLADREPPRAGDPVTWIEGDIVVCRDVAERQAAARGHDARTELLLYAVHGLMHLLGEDDHAEEDYSRMHRREDELLTEMGLGPVFHRERLDTPVGGVEGEQA